VESKLHQDKAAVTSHAWVVFERLSVRISVEQAAILIEVLRALVQAFPKCVLWHFSTTLFRSLFFF
jgi:hypothetical protein